MKKPITITVDQDWIESLLETSRSETTEVLAFIEAREDVFREYIDNAIIEIVAMYFDAWREESGDLDHE